MIIYYPFFWLSYDSPPFIFKVSLLCFFFGAPKFKGEQLLEGADIQTPNPPSQKF